MAMTVASASSQEALVTLAGLSGIAALSIAFWVRRDATSSVQFVGFAETANNGACLVLFSDNNRYSSVETGSASAYTVAASGFTGWVHQCMVFDGSLSGNLNRCKVYRDGAIVTSVGVGTIPAVTPAISTFRVGRSFSQAYYSNGGFAEVAVWNAALTAEEAVSLANGFKPSRVRRSALRSYADLVRNVQCLVTGGMTTANSPSATTHPKVY